MNKQEDFGSLVISIKPGESIQIGDFIKISLTPFNRKGQPQKKTSIHIEAPKNIPIGRITQKASLD